MLWRHAQPRRARLGRTTTTQVIAGNFRLYK
jgi:hypothetical protein